MQSTHGHHHHQPSTSTTSTGSMLSLDDLKNINISLIEHASVGDEDEVNEILQDLKDPSRPFVSIAERYKIIDRAQVSTKKGNPLMVACENGHVNIARLLVNAGANLKEDANGHEIDPLYSSSERGHADVVQFLVTVCGLDPNSKNRHSESSALSIAAANGHTKVVECLLTAGADPNLSDSHGPFALHRACENGHSAVIAMLLNASADPEAIDNSRNCDETLRFPLSRAAAGNHIDAVATFLDILLPNDAYTATTLKGTQEALQIACEHGYTDIVTTLLSAGVLPDDSDDDRCNSLYLAASGNHFEVVSALINLCSAHERNIIVYGNLNVDSPLHVAADAGFTEVVRVLLEAGVDPNLVCDNESVVIPPLHLAALKGHADIVRLLINAEGININFLRQGGRSALHESAKVGNLEIVRDLVKKGINLNLHDVNQPGRRYQANEFVSGGTALLVAAAEGHWEIVEELINSGADPKIPSSFGDTALHFAARRQRSQHIIELLLRLDLDPERENDDEESPICVAHNRRTEKILEDYAQSRRQALPPVNRVLSMSSPAPSAQSDPATPLWTPSRAPSPYIPPNPQSHSLRLPWSTILTITSNWKQELTTRPGYSGGRVFMGFYDGADVVVKMVPKSLQNELDVLLRVKHPNILQLLGFSIEDPRDIALVFPYMSRGDLWVIMKDFTENRSVRRLPCKIRTQFMIDIAVGVDYLHNQSPRIIHRDLKLPNILITGLNRAVVADVGIAKIVQSGDTHVTATRALGSDGYRAPEYVSSLKCTEKTDVFALGVMMLELLTEQCAYCREPEMFLHQAARSLHIALMNKAITEETLRDNLVEYSRASHEGDCIDDSFPVDIFMSIFRLAMRCVDLDPAARPSAAEVANNLAHLITSNFE